MSSGSQPANALDNDTVVLLVGDTPGALAAAARETANSARRGRRVAIFDLAGAFGLGDPDGLVAAFRDGRSLNALARPLDERTADQFIVPRGPGALDPALAGHDRWPRLIDGFRSTGALLILTARGNFAGTPDLVALADRAFRVADMQGTVQLEQLPKTAEPLSAHEEPAAPPEPAPALAPEAPAPEPAALTWVRTEPADRARRRVRRWTALAAAAVLAVAIGGWAMISRRPHPKPALTLHADSLAAIDARPSRPAATVKLPPLANPNDSARAARWGVELLATNDRTDANFRLAEHALPAGTLSPVLLGGDSAPWYKIVAGAFVDRTAAEFLRAELRRMGRLEAEGGVVSRVPYALRLDTTLTPAIATARAEAYVKRGVAAYALLDDDGRATIYAGAFASPEQAVVLLAELHAAGITPDLAFRVGRTY